MTDEKELVNSTIAVLKPKIEETIKAIIDGNLAEKIPQLKTSMQSELWDKAVAEIGKQMNLPVDIIKKLQQVDDLLKTNQTGIEKSLKEMIEKVEAFKDRLKGVDLAKTVTMSYKELQNERVKSALSWSLVTFILGFFGGIVWLIYYLKLI